MEADTAEVGAIPSVRPVRRRRKTPFQSSAELAELTPVEKAQEVHRERPKRRRRTERAFLDLIVKQIGADDVKAIGKAICKRARAGDKDALAWFGKYVLGGGKVSLDDIANPPVIKRGKAR